MTIQQHFERYESLFLLRSLNDQRNNIGSRLINRRFRNLFQSRPMAIRL